MGDEGITCFGVNFHEGNTMSCKSMWGLSGRNKERVLGEKNGDCLCMTFEGFLPTPPHESPPSLDVLRACKQWSSFLIHTSISGSNHVTIFSLFQIF